MLCCQCAKVVPWSYIGAILLAMVFIAGCSGLLIHQAIGKGDMPTAAQLEEINKTGHKAFVCLFVSGPPPGGAFQMFLVPKESKQEIKFKDRCEVGT